MEGSSCENCKRLLFDLENKQNIIQKIQAHVRKLTRILIEKNLTLYHVLENSRTELDEVILYENEISNLTGRFSCNNAENSRDIVFKSTETQTLYDDFFDKESKEDARKSPRRCGSKTADFSEKGAPLSDYVYNEEYKMYYSHSTGYYYDQEKGVFLQLSTGACYKYDYDSQQYELVSENDFNKFYKQVDDVSCEVMVKQVNMNEKTVSTDSDLQTSELIVGDLVKELVEQCSGMSEYVYDETTRVYSSPSTGCCYAPGIALEEGENSLLATEESDECTNSADPTSDWKVPEGKNLTVGDLVKEVVQQCSDMSDYVYDERSRMYYSPYTGYYYDPVTQLLHDTSNRISYRYDNENQSYEYFGKWKSENWHNMTKNKKFKAHKAYLRHILPKELHDEKVCDDDGKHISENKFNSREDGELFSSDSDSEPLSKNYCPEYEPAHKDFSKAYPPCIRMIVEHSETLQAGSLMMVSHKGGVIGRDEDSFLYIPDSCISKMHAEIEYNHESKKYMIKDLGSQNGTFINDKRLSEPKENSEFCYIEHGDRLFLGSCRLLLHIHPGADTCDECEPGQVLAQLSSKEEKSNQSFKTLEEKEKERKQGLQKLKQKYGLKGMEYHNKIHAFPGGYQDKAHMRRCTIGSDNPYEKIEEASVHVPMPSTNKGYKMLQKMGWEEGKTLGTQNSGLLDPVSVQKNSGRAGLGRTSVHLEESKSAKKKRKIFAITQQRYSQAT